MPDANAPAQTIQAPAPDQPVSLREAKLRILRQDWAGALRMLDALAREGGDAAAGQDVATLTALCRERLGQGQARAQASPEPAPAPAGPASAARAAVVSLAQASPAPAARAGRPRMLLCCLPGMDNFVDDLIAGLAPWVQVRKLVSGEPEEFRRALAGHDLVWLEWGNELAQWLTRQAARDLAGKRVILRVHSYEVLDGLADKIDFSLVHDLIFVAPHIRDIFLARRPEVAAQVKRVHVVPNGVDMRRFALGPAARGFDIAFLGQINFKKDPMVLLQAFGAVHARDTRLRLHVGGGFEQERYAHAMRHFVARNGLDGAVLFHGRIKNPHEWLADKRYIICSSLMEGHPVGLLEAMACGCQPLIYNWPGAEAFYPAGYIWNNIEELWGLLHGPYSPEPYRRFVEENYSLEIQVNRLAALLLEEIPQQHQPPRVQAAAFAPDPAWFAPFPAQRYPALVAQARRSLAEGDLATARTFGERAFLASRFRSQEAVNLLDEVYRGQGDILGPKETWKRMGAAALEDGDLDLMLKSFYKSIYSEMFYPRVDSSPNYSSFVIDHDIHAYLMVAAQRLPLARTMAAEMAARRDRRQWREQGRLRVGAVLETIDLNQAPIKAYLALARNLDRARFDLTVYCRYPLDSMIGRQQNFAAMAGVFREAGVQVVFAEGGEDWLACVQDLAAKMLAARLDVAVFNSVYLSPPLNLLARLRPALLVGCSEPQQPENNFSVDFTLNVGKGLLDSALETHPKRTLVERRPASGRLARADLGLPEDAVVLTCAARAVRYQTNLFWQQLGQVLRRHPRAVFLAVGLSAQEATPPALALNQSQLRLPGYRQDIPDVFALCDVFVDLVPSGTGAAMVEAMWEGVPAVTMGLDYRTPFAIATETVAGEWNLPELNVAHADYASWQRLLDRLIDDPAHRRAMGERSREHAHRLFNPAEQVREFGDLLEEIFARRLEGPRAGGGQPCR